MRGRKYNVLSSQVVGLAARSGCTAYDCGFVALARELRAGLVTSDRQMLRTFPTTAVALDAFVA